MSADDATLAAITAVGVDSCAMVILCCESSDLGVFRRGKGRY